MTVLKQDEAVGLDADRLALLCRQIGPNAAEDMLCRALEELANRLAQTERCHRNGRMAEMRKSARSLIAMSEQIGMGQLARVAADVTGCLDAGDRVALAATLARLVRVGERSFCEIWEARVPVT